MLTISVAQNIELLNEMHNKCFPCGQVFAVTLNKNS